MGAYARLAEGKDTERHLALGSTAGYREVGWCKLSRQEQALGLSLMWKVCAVQR